MKNDPKYSTIHPRVILLESSSDAYSLIKQAKRVGLICIKMDSLNKFYSFDEN